MGSEFEWHCLIWCMGKNKLKFWSCIIHTDLWTIIGVQSTGQMKVIFWLFFIDVASLQQALLQSSHLQYILCTYVLYSLNFLTNRVENVVYVLVHFLIASNKCSVFTVKDLKGKDIVGCRIGSSIVWLLWYNRILKDT